MDKIQLHNIILKGKTAGGGSVVLRPMTENDWDILFKWNQDPEVLYYSDTGFETSYTMEFTQSIYRGTSKSAFIFVIEYNGKPIGECWLQRMNLAWILEKFPDKDCRRIDLMIGEKDHWGKGIGTVVVKLLSDFGFKREKADMIFGCHIANYNARSLKVFEKEGFRILRKKKLPPGGKAKFEYYMIKES